MSVLLNLKIVHVEMYEKYLVFCLLTNFRKDECVLLLLFVFFFTMFP